jgi:hypothetical protein
VGNRHSIAAISVIMSYCGNNSSAMKSSIFWDIMSCSLLKVSQRLGVTYRLHLQDRRICRAWNQRESSLQLFITTAVRTLNSTSQMYSLTTYFPCFCVFSDMLYPFICDWTGTDAKTDRTVHKSHTSHVSDGIHLWRKINVSSCIARRLVLEAVCLSHCHSPCLTCYLNVNDWYCYCIAYGVCFPYEL